MQEVTQEDIARECKVSRETVTKALQNHPMVSNETKRRVHAMAQRMGYTPNFNARNLSSRKTRTIGIIVPKISHSFHASMLEMMYKFAGEKGYNVIPMISFEEKRNEYRNINTMMSMRVDGIIANISQDSADNNIYLDLHNRGVPVVFFDRLIEHPKISHVTSDDREAAFRILDHALSKGYKKPAHLAGYRNISIGKERRNGFLDALKKHNIQANPDWMIEGGFSEELRYENAKLLLKARNRPDLIFCFNDSIALSVYKVAAELQISIPDELGVIGYGNLALGKLISPKLSTVDLPLEEFAQQIIRLMINQIESQDNIEIEHVLITPEIIIRESCR